MIIVKKGGKKSLLELFDVSKVKVSLKDKTSIIYSESSVKESNIVSAINKLDYEVISIGEEK